MSENTNDKHTMISLQKDNDSSDFVSDDEEQKQAVTMELEELKDKALHYSTNIKSIDAKDILDLYDSISFELSLKWSLMDRYHELASNLYEKHKSIPNHMIFRIVENSGCSNTNNIYILHDNIFKCMIMTGCRCCSGEYFIIDIIFSNFEEKMIEILKINEIDVYPTLHDIIYKWVLKKMKDNYIEYLLLHALAPDDHNRVGWKYNINNLNILKKFVNIPDTVKICEQCRYYNLDITLPCPIERIHCCNYKYCSTIIERKNMDKHLIKCNKTKYNCNNKECKDELYIDEMQEHEYQCIYRKAVCFDCPWCGYYKDKKNHERVKLDGSNWMPWEADSDKICSGGK
jgi:hypothetical protein